MSPRAQKTARRLRTARRKFPARAGLLSALLITTVRALANPQGMVVAGGSASAVVNGQNLDITAGHNAVINWSSFNIGAGETTTFHQPAAVSVVWNRIADANPSQIWGNLNANGMVVLMNRSGFFFGPNSSINVGGFIAITAPFNPPLPAGAPVWAHPAAPPLASIINYGQVKVGNGGSLFLVAEKIDNHGVLTAPDGTLGLYAGKEVLISERPDGRGLSAQVTLEEGSIDNRGQISADGGSIALRARVVNQDGIIQANSIRSRNGIIELVASDAVYLGAASLIQANGDAVGMSDAGQVTIKSAGTFSDASGSRLEARGGANGGNGGAVEVSALTLGDIHSRIDGAAQAGFAGGRMLVDPYDLTLTGGALAPYYGFSQILLQADHDITVADYATLNLALSTEVETPGSRFALEAGNDILFGDNARIIAGNGWSVSLAAGVDFSSPTHETARGVGSIRVNPDGTSYSGIETADGNITLNAGHEVQVGSGYVRTVGGGNIYITTGDGDVNSGTYNQTYDHSDGTYTDADHHYQYFGAPFSAEIGGIGTAGGGHVTVHAGQDIVSINANIGALGENPGDVKLTAARDVKGNFLVRNGSGNVTAGQDVGFGSGGASFGLIGGSWEISALRDIYLNEIYNPNGSLTAHNATYGAGVPFQFDYAADARVRLAAGSSVQLLGDNPRSGHDPIYAPILDIIAGPGGVTLGNNVILHPSVQGHLRITTTDHGALRSRAGGYYQLVMSDSDSPEYTSFINGHAAVPLHLGGSTPVMQLDIAGDLENLFLQSAGSADIQVQGDVTSMAFRGQNLAGGEVTKLTIDGNYFSRSQSDRTSVTLAGDATAAFTRIFADQNQTLNPSLAAKLSYDAATRKLSVRGTLTAADLNFLLNPIRYEWDELRGYALEPNGSRSIIADEFTTDTDGLRQLYADALQNIPASPLADSGLQIGGPGLFRVTAANMNLGVSSGIRSVGTFLNPNLAAVSASGANIDLNLTGNLDMTSSQIASFNGGGIHVQAGGYLNVGSQTSLTSDSTPKGIYTGHGGSVFVQAGGDVNVSGSRIASYDGGDVSVISEHGNVDAGDGAKGFFYVTTSSLNPLTGQVEQRNDKFFGSGIVALTQSDSQTRVGDIHVHADGDIRAGSGGILQLAFNDYDQTGAKVTMLSDAGSIYAGQSGVLGKNLEVSAPQGSIEGIFVAGGDAEIRAQNNVNVTALAGGTASVSGGGNVSGTIVGGTGASVAGGEGVTASVISTGGSASANGSESSGSAFAGVAPAVAQKTTEAADKTIANNTLVQNDEEDEQKKKRGAKPALARRVSRVTVILTNPK